MKLDLDPSSPEPWRLRRNHWQDETGEYNPTDSITGYRILSPNVRGAMPLALSITIHDPLRRTRAHIRHPIPRYSWSAELFCGHARAPLASAQPARTRANACARALAHPALPETASRLLRDLYSARNARAVYQQTPDGYRPFVTEFAQASSNYYEAFPPGGYARLAWSFHPGLRSWRLHASRLSCGFIGTVVGPWSEKHDGPHPIRLGLFCWIPHPGPELP